VGGELSNAKSAKPKLGKYLPPGATNAFGTGTKGGSCNSRTGAFRGRFCTSSCHRPKTTCGRVRPLWHSLVASLLNCLRGMRNPAKLSVSNARTEASPAPGWSHAPRAGRGHRLPHWAEPHTRSSSMSTALSGFSCAGRSRLLLKRWTGRSECQMRPWVFTPSKQ
jgi:hypothetical protein